MRALGEHAIAERGIVEGEHGTCSQVHSIAPKRRNKGERLIVVAERLAEIDGGNIADHGRIIQCVMDEQLFVGYKLDYHRYSIVIAIGISIGRYDGDRIGGVGDEIAIDDGKRVIFADGAKRRGKGKIIATAAPKHPIEINRRWGA